MRDPAEHLSRIRGEIASDLGKVEEEIRDARTAASQAEAGHLAAVEEWKALETRAARGGEKYGIHGGLIDYVALASPLHSRLLDVRDELIKPAERARGQARARISALEYRRGALLESLEQIDRASRGEGSPVVRLEPLPKRVALIVEFDNVSPVRSSA
jgi:hypothetical protein